MPEIVLHATHHEGRTEIRQGPRRLVAACGEDAFDARALLAAAVAACVSATLDTLLQRQGIVTGIDLRVLAVDETLHAEITLPRAAQALSSRCARAAARCPVVSALARPVRFEWKFRD